MEDLKKTKVAGEETGGITKSGNSEHNADGTFGSKEKYDLGTKQYINKISFATKKNVDYKQRATQLNINNSIINFFENNIKNTQLKEETLTQICDMVEKYGIDLTFTQAKSMKMQAIAGISFGAKRKISNSGTPYMQFLMNNNLIINPNYFNASINEFNANVRAAVNAKWFFDCDQGKEYLYVITHEMGHAFFNTFYYNLLKSRNLKTGKATVLGHNFNNINNEMNNIVKTWHDDIEKIYLSQNPTERHLKASGYARSEMNKGNYQEWFAETFASLNCGKPGKSALLFEKYMKEKGYFK